HCSVPLLSQRELCIVHLVLTGVHMYPLPVAPFFFFFQAEDGIRDFHVTGVQTCALPIWPNVAGDEDGVFTCMPAGWWLDLGGKRLYHAGDTALITDMQLLKGRVDIALLPIGDNYTMGPEDAARAVEFIEPRIVVPMHYNTFDLIRQDPTEFARHVGARARVEILRPGESLEF